MADSTTYIDREEFQKDIGVAIFGLSDKYDKISSLLTEDLTSIDANTLHLIGKLLKPTTPLERGFYKLLGRSLLQAESLAGGSAILGLRFSVGLLKSLLVSGELKNKPDTALLREYNDILLTLGNIIQETYQVPTIEDLWKQTLATCGDALVAKVVFEAIKIAGLEGKIYIENGRQNNYVIERKTGYNFKTKPFKFFLDTSSNAWERQNVKVLLVDGVLEQVSEIDQLLNGALTSRQPGMIVARGFSEEVVATLKANFDRGILDIIPVRINSDLESINILNDIASVCGTDIVSSLKGELVCFVKWESLPSIQKIRCMTNLISIEESKTRNQVTAQVKHLLNKRLDNQNLEDVVTLIDERIKSLTSESVVIRLPTITAMENQTIRTKFDTCLRSTKSILNNGLVSLPDVVRKFKLGDNSTPLQRAVLSSLEALEVALPDKVSSLSAFLALNICGKQALMIYTSNGAVITEE